MRIVVIGGSGNIGSRLVKKLVERGHGVLAASPKSGVNAVTGEGLADAFFGADVVVDVANSPSFDTEPAMKFFSNAGRNLAAEEKRAGVKHHVALSVVGTDRLQESGYFRAKLAQEELVKSSGIPYTILRATQFFEFVGPIAESFAADGVIRATSAGIQPIASEDVAARLAEIATSKPVNQMLEVAGPEPFQMDQIIRKYLAEISDRRRVVTDDQAQYFGLTLSPKSLLPGPNAYLASNCFSDWLRRSTRAPHPVAG